MKQHTLTPTTEQQPDGPAECLGQTPNDAARREHYLDILRDKLKDPEFRAMRASQSGRTRIST